MAGMGRSARETSEAERLLRRATVLPAVVTLPDSRSADVPDSAEDTLCQAAQGARRLRLWSMFGGLAVAGPGTMAVLNLTTHRPILLGDFVVALAACGTMFVSLSAEAATHRDGQSSRAALTLVRGRRWRSQPAALLTSRALANAGLHRRVADELVDEKHTQVAAALLEGGFCGSVTELIDATRSVLTPVG